MAIYITPFIDFLRSSFRPSKPLLKLKKEHPDNNKPIPQHPSSGTSNRQGHPATAAPIDKGSTGHGSTWHDMERVTLFAKGVLKGNFFRSPSRTGPDPELGEANAGEARKAEGKTATSQIDGKSPSQAVLDAELGAGDANAGKGEQADERKAVTSQSDGKSEK
jgi:hypothetical protein